MKDITVHFISYFFIIRIYWHINCNISWHIICRIDWCNIGKAYSFIVHNYWIIKNAFQIPANLRNSCARIQIIIFFVHAVLFTLTLAFTIIQFLIWATYCTIKFAFTIGDNIFYQYFNFIYCCDPIKYIHIYVFCFTPETCFCHLSRLIMNG